MPESQSTGRAACGVAAPTTPPRRGTSRRGFTLIEAALTMTIVGVGVVASLQLLAAGTAANVDGALGTTAINLARNVREMSFNLTFDELRGLNKTTFSPPIDSGGVPLAGFDGWAQSVVVQPVSADRLTRDVADADPDVLRVTVSMSHGGRHVADLSWYRFRPID